MPKTTKSPEITKSVEQIERERLTRRQALRKLGFGAGLSAFMLLGVDDLARMVGDKMQQMAGDNQVANQVAKEFQSAGIAFAAGPSGGGPSGISCADCTTTCVEDDDHYCVDCDASCSSPSQSLSPSGISTAAQRSVPKPPLPQACTDYHNGNIGDGQCQECSSNLLELCNSGGSCNCDACYSASLHYGCDKESYKNFYDHWHDCAKCIPSLPAP